MHLPDSVNEGSEPLRKDPFEELYQTWGNDYCDERTRKRHLANCSDKDWRGGEEFETTVEDGKKLC